MPNLYLLRHFKSQWNLENRFAGWVDNPLSKEGRESAEEARKKISGLAFDLVFTSPLVRNIETTLMVFQGEKYPLFMHLSGKMKKWGNFKGNGSYVPAYLSEELNERYYGRLQGLNREEVKKEFGEEKFNSWRRGFASKPPSGESLKDTYNRTIPFFKRNIENQLRAKKNVLIIGSHNALRSIAKYIENISDNDIPKFEIPYGGIINYNLSDKAKFISKENL